MTKTLKTGTHQLVFTSGVTNRIADDNKFAKFVWKSLLRFNRGDWGDVGEYGWKSNDAELIRDGWILAVYSDQVFLGHAYHVWIIRNTSEEDVTQSITVLFPYERSVIAEPF